MVVIFVGYLVMKIVRAPDRKKWLWGSDSLVPHPQDGRDFVKQWKWYFTGKHADRPKFGRYGYLEKLDFFGEVWGFVIIGGSGIMLWFPITSEGFNNDVFSAFPYMKFTMVMSFGG